MSLVPINSQPCHLCYAPAAPLKCGSCKVTKYCSKECQTIDWKLVHRYLCAPQGKSPKPIQGKVVFTECCESIRSPKNPVGMTTLHRLIIEDHKTMIPPELFLSVHHVITSRKTTPAIMESLMQPVKKNELTQIFLPGAERPLDQKEFFQITGLHYTGNGIFMLPEDIMKYYLDPEQQFDNERVLNSNNPKDAKIIDAFKLSPPELELCEESPIMGRGMKARTSIERDQLICCMGGQLASISDIRTRFYENQVGFGTKEESSVFPMNFKYDSHSGAGTFINCGPPNCRLIRVVEDNGLPPAFYLIALKEIKTNEWIHLDYDTHHSVKIRKHILTEASYEEVVHFCQEMLSQPKQVDLIKMILANLHLRDAASIAAVAQFYPQFPHIKNMMRYILSLPTLFFKLHLQNVLNPELMIPFLEDMRIKKLFRNDRWLESPSNYPTLLRGVFDLSMEFQMKIEQAAASLSNRNFVDFLKDIVSHPSPLILNELEAYLKKAELNEQLHEYGDDDFAFYDEATFPDFDFDSFLTKWNELQEMPYIAASRPLIIKIIKLYQKAVDHNHPKRKLAMETIFNLVPVYDLRKMPLDSYLSADNSDDERKE